LKTVLLTLLVAFGLFQKGLTQKIESDLTFIYWMPYDNNLSVWSDSIYAMINTGITNEKIIVTVQKDDTGIDGMTRSIITKNEIINETIEEDNSASGISYDQYLEWVAQKVRSKKYVIVFLDHGGKLDQVGLDEYPNKEFLRIDSIKIAIEKFNRLNGKKAEMIFLQVCTKGSIEPIYELKDVANYTMFSQTVLGAPNFYYTSFFREISISSELAHISGLKMAELIAQFERADMYQSLVCIDNSKFDTFTKEFKSFLGNYTIATDYRISNNLLLFYYGQTYFDLISFIESFQGIDNRKLIVSINELVVMNKINPENNLMQGYCGISLLAMQKDYLEKVKIYEHLAFFNSFYMSNLFLKSKELLGK
jgi:cysteine peptidase C11 family protein